MIRGFAAIDKVKDSSNDIMTDSSLTGPSTVKKINVFQHTIIDGHCILSEI